MLGSGRELGGRAALMAGAGERTSEAREPSNRAARGVWAASSPSAPGPTLVETGTRNPRGAGQAGWPRAHPVASSCFVTFLFHVHPQ
eukprot:1853872-Prymnesium_polylepis.1